MLWVKVFEVHINNITHLKAFVKLKAIYMAFPKGAHNVQFYIF